MKEVNIRLARNTKKAVVRYDRQGNAVVSLKTTSGKKRSFKVKTTKA